MIQMGQQLGSETNSEEWNVTIGNFTPDQFIDTWCVFIIDRVVRSGENETLGNAIVVGEEFLVDGGSHLVVGINFAKDVQLTDTTGNELGVLRTKVDDDDLFVGELVDHGRRCGGGCAGHFF